MRFFLCRNNKFAILGTSLKAVMVSFAVIGVISGSLCFAQTQPKSKTQPKTKQIAQAQTVTPTAPASGTTQTVPPIATASGTTQTVPPTAPATETAQTTPAVPPVNSEQTPPQTAAQEQPKPFDTTGFGTRQDPISAKPANPVGYWSVFQMLLALGVVAVAVKFLLPKWLAFVSKGRMGASSGSEIQVLDARPIGTAAIHLVSVRGKTLLIGVTQTNVNLLANLTIDEEPLEVVDSDFDTTLRQTKVVVPSQSSSDTEAVKLTVDSAIERLKMMTK